MQTPPPFHGYEGSPQPPKRKNNTVVILLAVLGGLLICCGLPLGIAGYFGYKGIKGGIQMVGCMANVSMMKDAMRQYSKEHDGKLPSAKTWQADIGKYMVSKKDMESAPMNFWKAGGEWSCEDGGTKTGFMFNEKLSEKKISDVKKADPEAVAIFETKTVVFNQSGPFVKLPFNESPKFMADFTDERRGWFIIDAEATNLYTINKNGKRVVFNMDDMNSGRSGRGVNVKINSDSSDDSSKSKEDNSN